MDVSAASLLRTVDGGSLSAHSRLIGGVGVMFRLSGVAEVIRRSFRSGLWPSRLLPVDATVV